MPADRQLRVIVHGGRGDVRVELKRGRSKSALHLNSLSSHDKAMAYARQVAHAIGIPVLDLNTVQFGEWHTEDERIFLALQRQAP